jgi:hypothetical protein
VQAAKRLGVSRKKMMEAMREREGYSVGERWVVELAQRKHGGGNNGAGASSSGQHNPLDPDGNPKGKRRRKGDEKDKGKSPTTPMTRWGRQTIEVRPAGALRAFS